MVVSVEFLAFLLSGLFAQRSSHNTIVSPIAISDPPSHGNACEAVATRGFGATVESDDEPGERPSARLLRSVRALANIRQPLNAAVSIFAR